VGQQFNLVALGKNHQVLWDRAAIVNVHLVDQRLDLANMNKEVK